MVMTRKQRNLNVVAEVANGKNGVSQVEMNSNFCADVPVVNGSSTAAAFGSVSVDYSKLSVNELLLNIMETNKDPVVAQMLSALCDKMPKDFADHLVKEKRSRSIVLAGLKEVPTIAKLLAHPMCKSEYINGQETALPKMARECLPDLGGLSPKYCSSPFQLTLPIHCTASQAITYCEISTSQALIVKMFNKPVAFLIDVVDSGIILGTRKGSEVVTFGNGLGAMGGVGRHNKLGHIFSLLTPFCSVSPDIQLLSRSSEVILGVEITDDELEESVIPSSSI
ncbi:unnamed protein product [Haemonchus placei]|uniref:DUF4476 domain-containing protein n=1 Tax=Haemonchus placei TaxID=6290 RepID=A0A0N4X6U1_HAEPC|nr:unnamed protein product [Haemonchus placei]